MLRDPPIISTCYVPGACSKRNRTGDLASEEETLPFFSATHIPSGTQEACLLLFTTFNQRSFQNIDRNVQTLFRRSYKPTDIAGFQIDLLQAQAVYPVRKSSTAIILEHLLLSSTPAYFTPAYLSPSTVSLGAAPSVLSSSRTEVYLCWPDQRDSTLPASVEIAEEVSKGET